VRSIPREGAIPPSAIASPAVASPAHDLSTPQALIVPGMSLERAPRSAEEVARALTCAASLRSDRCAAAPETTPTGSVRSPVRLRSLASWSLLAGGGSPPHGASRSVVPKLAGQWAWSNIKHSRLTVDDLLVRSDALVPLEPLNGLEKEAYINRHRHWQPTPHLARLRAKGRGEVEEEEEESKEEGASEGVRLEEGVVERGLAAVMTGAEASKGGAGKETGPEKGWSKREGRRLVIKLAPVLRYISACAMGVVVWQILSRSESKRGRAERQGHNQPGLHLWKPMAQDGDDTSGEGREWRPVVSGGRGGDPGRAVVSMSEMQCVMANTHRSDKMVPVYQQIA